MEEYKLFEATQVGSTALLNHIVMAPITRCRAIGNIPNDLMAKYYEQRSAAGLILCGDYGKENSEAYIKSGLANLIAFGRPFINNPDLAERMANDWPLSKVLHMDLFYSTDDKGYTDYLIYQQQAISE